MLFFIAGFPYYIAAKKTHHIPIDGKVSLHYLPIHLMLYILSSLFIPIWRFPNFEPQVTMGFNTEMV